MLKNHVRQTLALILVLTLMSCSSAYAYIDMSKCDYNASLNLIWDIPFNIPMEEFVEKAYEKTGFVFSGKNTNGVNTDFTQTISLLGHTLSNAIASGDMFQQEEYDGKYCNLMLGFADNESNVETFTDVFDALSEKFGAFTSASCYLPEENDGTYYNFPYDKGGIDLSTLNRIVTENEKYSIYVTWKNVSLAFSPGVLYLSAKNYVYVSPSTPPSVGDYGALVMQVKDSDAGL